MSRTRGKSGSQKTRRWREMDSNFRSPVEICPNYEDGSGQIGGPRPMALRTASARKSGSHRTPWWRKQDSNPRSLGGELCCRVLSLATREGERHRSGAPWLAWFLLIGEPFQGAAGEYGFDGLRFALLLGRLGLHAPLRPASSRVQKGERRLR
jgi:hypothetical protein